MADDRSAEVRFISGIFFAIALIIVSLRCYGRLVIIKRFWWDDFLSILALTSYCVFCSFAIAGTFYGAAQKTHANDSAEVLALKYFWLCEVAYVFAVSLARVSAALLLLRITVNKHHIWSLYVCITTSSAVGLMWLIVMIFQCLPPSKFWCKQATGSCLAVDVVINATYVYSAFSAICDFIIGLLPLFILRKSRIQRMTRVVLVSVLGLACIASAAVIARLPYVAAFRQPDFLYATADMAIWSNVEVGLGISAGSIGTLRPLVRLLFCPNSRHGETQGYHQRTTRSSQASGIIGAHANYTAARGSIVVRPKIALSKTNTVHYSENVVQPDRGFRDGSSDSLIAPERQEERQDIAFKSYNSFSSLRATYL